MKIVKATVEDVPELQSLMQMCYRGDAARAGWTHESDLLDGTRISNEQLTEMMQKSGAVMMKGTDDTGKIISCVYTQVQNDKLYVGMLCVRPDLQANGYGKQLMNAVDEVAKENHCSAAKMKVITKRTELIEYYKRRGYRNTGEIEPFPFSESSSMPKMHLEMVVLQKDY